MSRLQSLAWVNGIALSFLGLAALANTSCGSQMSSSYTGTSPVPTPYGARALASELLACPDEFRPLRVAFIVDNTGSNGAKPGNIQRPPVLKGSDAIKSFDDDKYLLKDTDFSGLDTGNIFTYRQYAVYKSILKLQKSGIASRKSNSKYTGIDVGVAHFPKVSGDTATEEEMKEPVFYNGDSTGLPSKMTDVSQIESSTSFNQKLWNMLKFTHDSRGLTPYVTAFTAANSLLIDEKKADDQRQALMILVTDGLPTDRTPSSIKAARKALGANTRVVLLSIYGSDEVDDEVQNKEAKASLSALYSGGLEWGKEEHSTFESYWKALVAIPSSNEVRDDYIQVNSRNLQKSLDGVLDRYLTCKKK